MNLAAGYPNLLMIRFLVRYVVNNYSIHFSPAWLKHQQKYLLHKSLHPLLAAASLVIFMTVLVPDTGFSNEPEQVTGIDCGCSETGDYAGFHRGTKPKVTLVTLDEGTSPKEKYRIVTSADNINIYVNEAGGDLVLTINGIPENSGWGFSPDDHRFVFHYIVQGMQTVELYDLRQRPGELVKSISRTHLAGETSRIRFSPKGIYLFYLSVTSSGENSVSVVDTTGVIAHETSFTHFQGTGLEDDKFQNSLWNFSRDDHDRTLVYGWTTGQNSVEIRAVNLETRQIISELSLPVVYSSFWRFSRCADVMGLYIQEAGIVSSSTPNPVRIKLISTLDGNVLSNQTYSSLDYTVFSCDASNHMVTIGTNTYSLAPNSAGTACGVPPPPLAELKSFSITPSPVIGGETAGGTVTITDEALEEGFPISLSSNSEIATVSSEFTIPAGDTIATFDIQTTPVSENTDIVITASTPEKEIQTGFTVRTPRLKQLTLASDSVYSGNGTRLTAEIDGRAPSSGVTVSMEHVDNEAVELPESLTIWGGGTTGSVWIETRGVSDPLELEISGTYIQTRSTTLFVLPAELRSITYDFSIHSACVLKWTDDQAIGGRPIGFRVELNGEAPPDGADIAITSSNSEIVTPPANVTIGNRERSASFPVLTEPVTTTASIPIQVTYRQKTLERSLTLIKPPVQYYAQVLNPPDANRKVEPVALNNVGQVLLRSDRYYLWENGTFTVPELPAPEGMYDRVVDFNDRGQYTGTTNNHGAAVWQDGHRQALRTPNDTDPSSLRIAAINNKGQVAGNYINDENTNYLEVVRWTNGQPEELTSESYNILRHYILQTRDINESGSVAASGFRRYGAPSYLSLYIAAVFSENNTWIPRAYGSYPKGAYINNHHTWTGGNTQIFRLEGEGFAEIYPPHQTFHQYPEAINDREEIAGYAEFHNEMEGSTIWQAVRVTEEGTWPLECMIADPDEDIALHYAKDINNAGQMLAHSRIENEDENLEYFTWLLTPTDALRANLLIEITNDAQTVVTGSEITYIVTISNQGPEEAEAVRLAGAIPSNQQLISAESIQGTCEILDGTLHCELGSVASGEETTITLVTKAMVSGESEFTTVATSNTLEMNPESNRSTSVVTVMGGEPMNNSVDVGAGETGEVALQDAGIMMNITEPGTTDGSINATLHHEEPDNSQDLPMVTIQAPGGSIEPDSVLIDRYWTIEASGLEDLTFDLCLNISGLSGIDPDYLVITKRSDANGPWTAYNSTLRSVGNALYLCTEGLTEFSQLGIATETGTFSQPPEQPVLLTPEHESQNVAVDTSLTWQSDSRATAYHLQLAADEFYSDLVLDTVLTETSFPLPFALNHDQNYFWRVKAEVETEWGSWSEAWNFTTILSTPHQVNLAAPADGETIEPDEVLFVWESSGPEIQNYGFELAIDEDFLGIVIDSVVTDTLIQLSNLTDHTTYWWRVRAENTAGRGPYSVERYLVLAVVGTDPLIDIPEQYELRQNYPNPFNPVTQIMFALPESSNVTLEIYNVIGQRIAVLVNGRMEAGRHEVAFDASELSSGIYLYRIQAGEFMETHKMMIMK